MKYPITPAIRALRAAGVDFEPHLYAYEPKGGAAASSRELNVPLESVVKTLIFEDDRKQPLIVLMNGDRSVSTKSLARTLNAKAITPCDVKTAQKHSGYLVGGTSPFGVKRKMPVYMEQHILSFDRVMINGGKRGFLVSMNPKDIAALLSPQIVEVGLLS